MMQITIRVGLPRRRRRPTLREIAVGIAMLQRSESLLLHAQRDECMWCMMCAAALRHQGVHPIPMKLLKDRDWVHRHIEAPAARMHARGLDKELEGHG